MGEGEKKEGIEEGGRRGGKKSEDRRRGRIKEWEGRGRRKEGRGGSGKRREEDRRRREKREVERGLRGRKREEEEEEEGGGREVGADPALSGDWLAVTGLWVFPEQGKCASWAGQGPPQIPQKEVHTPAHGQRAPGIEEKGSSSQPPKRRPVICLQGHRIHSLCTQGPSLQGHKHLGSQSPWKR